MFQIKKFKICIFGASGVGKTAIIQQFAMNSFPEEYCGTVRPLVHSQTVMLDNRVYQLKILDLPPIANFPHNSLEEWKNGVSLRSASAYLLVYDASNLDSFQHIKSLKEQIYESRDMHNVPVLIVANKFDLIASTMATTTTSSGSSSSAPPSSSSSSESRERRDICSMSTDIPWRRISNAGKNNPPKGPAEPVPSTPATPQPFAEKPGGSKPLQINLKSTVKKADGGEQKGGKEIVVPIVKEVSIPIVRETSEGKPTTPRNNNNSIPNSNPVSSKNSEAVNPPPTTKPSLNKKESPTGRKFGPNNPDKSVNIPISKPKESTPPPPEPPFKRNLRPIQANKDPPAKTPSKVPEPKPSTMPEKKPPSAAGPPAPPPPPPPPPGGAPPPPPMPGLPPKGPPDPVKTQKLESLRKMPRKRPDWSVMMKEIETQRKLNHVECNDRSKPIIPRMKSRGKFVFDSEAKPANKADAIHNRLLTEIAGGVRLKKVQCNDRSKPILTGLRKFRRQLTEEGKPGAIAEEEAATPAAPNSEAEELIEMGMDIDDIDTLRDQLQSVKQMLELEIQAKILLAKENRDLKCQNITMEAQRDELRFKLEEQLSLIPYDEGRRDSRAYKDIRKSKSGLYKCPSGIRKSKSGFQGPKGMPKGDKKQGDEEDDLGELNELEEEITNLRAQILQAKKTAEDWEAKYKEASEALLTAQGKLEDSEQKQLVLNKKLEKVQNQKGVAISSNDKWTQTEEQIQQGVQGRRVSRQMSTRKPSDAVGGDGGAGTVNEGGSDDEYDSDASDLEVDEGTVIRKKQEREIKLWENKLKNVKEKQIASKLERKNLKSQQKKLEEELKEQKARLKELQKEVDKMAKMLKADHNEDGESNEGGSDEDEEEEEEEESEEEDDEDDDDSEEETESSSDEESSSEEDDDSASHEERLNLFGQRVKRWDNILNALRKGNYLLRANIDRLKDDLEDVRIKYHDLEHELNTVLADV